MSNRLAKPAKLANTNRHHIETDAWTHTPSQDPCNAFDNDPRGNNDTPLKLYGGFVAMINTSQTLFACGKGGF